MTIKPGHQTTGNARVVWSDESFFTMFPKSGKVYVWRTPKEACNPECMPGFNSEKRGFCDGLGSNIVVQYSVGPVITIHCQITARKCLERLGNQVHSVIQTFMNNYAGFQDDCPDSHSQNCSVMV
jgi:hypothetical protein